MWHSQCSLPQFPSLKRVSSALHTQVSSKMRLGPPAMSKTNLTPSGVTRVQLKKPNKQNGSSTLCGLFFSLPCKPGSWPLWATIPPFPCSSIENSAPRPVHLKYCSQPLLSSVPCILPCSTVEHWPPGWLLWSAQFPADPGSWLL